MDPVPDCGETSYRGTGRLTGKHAIVTGGDSGIGRAVSIAYAREGADVPIAYLQEDDDAREVANYVGATRSIAVRWSTKPPGSSVPSTCSSTTPATR
jgi:NAD(P)-dependent dehydrogenase (short-subunit alcohol dehydrogenase family)